MKFDVTIELVKVKGADQDTDTVLDAFAGAIGRDNAAPKPLRVTIRNGEGEVAAVYEVKSVDDR